MHSSYVVTDPKGGLVNEVGNALYKNGYRMKVFNTINFSNQCTIILLPISILRRIF